MVSVVFRTGLRTTDVLPVTWYLWTRCQCHPLHSEIANTFRAVQLAISLVRPTRLLLAAFLANSFIRDSPLFANRYSS